MNNTERKLSGSSLRWHCSFRDLPPPPSPAHLLGVSWGKDERMWSPFVECVRCFSQQEPNSSLSYVTGTAHFSLTANSHHNSHLPVHHTSSCKWTSSAFRCQDLWHNPINLNGRFSGSILSALMSYTKNESWANSKTDGHLFCFFNLSLNYMFVIWNYVNVFF